MIDFSLKSFAKCLYHFSDVIHELAFPAEQEHVAPVQETDEAEEETNVFLKTKAVRSVVTLKAKVSKIFSNLSFRNSCPLLQYAVQ